MFNKFGKDPLVEAVKQAQADGETRRAAIQIVNEEFGVYSRNALVVEQIAEYDAAVEEVYKALKEGLDPVGKEDDDIDNDGRKNTKSDKYLKHRRDVRSAAIKEGSAYDNKNPFDPNDGSVQRGSTEVSDSKATSYDKTLPKEYPGAASSTGAADRIKKAGGLQEEEQIDEASVKLNFGHYEVHHRGERVGRYVAKYEAKEHAAQLNHEAKMQARRNKSEKAAKEAKKAQLDELSKDTLGRYAKKASVKAKHHALDAERAYDSGNVDKGDHNVWKSEKRQQGVRRAINKLTGNFVRVAANEEAQLDELTGKGKLPALSAHYRSNEKYHSGLTNYHHGEADRAERANDQKGFERHMVASMDHDEYADKETSKLRRSNALSKRAKAHADLKAAKANSKSARADYREETQISEDEASDKKRRGLVDYIRKASASKATPNNITKRSKGLKMAADRLEKLKNVSEGVDPVHAKQILDQHNAHGDFHALKSSTVQSLVDTAKKMKYRKSSSAPGSTGRMFHQHLTRQAAKVVKEEALDERYHVVTSNYSLEPGEVGKRTSEDQVHSKHKSLKAAARKLTTAIGNTRASKYEILDTHTGKRMSRNQARDLAEQQLDEIGFSNRFSPLKKSEKDSGYVNLGHKKGYGYSSSNPDMRINRRAGLDKHVGWDDDAQGEHDKQQRQMAKFKAKAKSRLKEEIEQTISEAVSRKHFQQVADLIKSHDSQEKRNELASHHAEIFAKQNPRFSHERFHAAAGSTALQTKKVNESSKGLKRTFLNSVAKVEKQSRAAGGLYWDNHHPPKEVAKAKKDHERRVDLAKKVYKRFEKQVDESFKSALASGKSAINEMDYTPPPSFDPPAISGQRMAGTVKRSGIASGRFVQPQRASAQAPRAVSRALTTTGGRSPVSQSTNVPTKTGASGVVNATQSASKGGSGFTYSRGPTTPGVNPPHPSEKIGGFGNVRPMATKTAIRGLAVRAAGRAVGLAGLAIPDNNKTEPGNPVFRRNDAGKAQVAGYRSATIPRHPAINTTSKMVGDQSRRSGMAPSVRNQELPNRINPVTTKAPGTLSSPAPAQAPKAAPAPAPKEAPVAPPKETPNTNKSGYFKGNPTGNYTIKRGDTISSIARSTKQSVADIAKMNKITDVNKVSTGAKLATSVPTPPVRPSSDSADNVKKQFGTMDQLKKDTATAQAPKPEPTIKQAEPATPAPAPAPKVEPTPAPEQPKMNGPSWADQEKAIKNTPEPSSYVPDSAKVGRTPTKDLGTPTLSTKGFVKESPVTPGSTIDDPNDTKRSGKTPGNPETGPGIAGGSTGPDNAESLSKTTPSKLRESVTVGNNKYRII